MFKFIFFVCLILFRAYKKQYANITSPQPILFENATFFQHGKKENENPFECFHSIIVSIFFAMHTSSH